MMLDIRGFTGATARLAPQEVVALLTRLHARIIPAVRRHNGVVDKFLGDGVMVTFGAVRPSQRPAADALAALEAVLAEADSWQREAAEETGVRLVVNGAVAAGPVMFAVVGALDRLEYTVIGEAVNLAAKLEKHNKVEATRALTTAETLAMARVQGWTGGNALLARPAQIVAGAAQPIDLVALG